jgi:hypothetical protein
MVGLRSLEIFQFAASQAEPIVAAVGAAVAEVDVQYAKYGKIYLTFMLALAIVFGMYLNNRITGAYEIPSRMQMLEDAIVQISQDLCVIRAATEGLDAVECIRRIR